MNDAAKPTLYLVPNALDQGAGGDDALPLEQLLPRSAIEVAARLEHWVVENARSARAFLKRVDAVVPLHRPLQVLAIVELPRPVKGPRAAPPGDMAALLAPARDGRDIGLLSEAGLAALADPGTPLVAAAHAQGLRVVALPGASAVALAVAAGGLDGQSFAFVGYVPVEPAERAARLRALEATSREQRQSQIMIETPYRNRALLDAIVATLRPDTRLSVSVGLSLRSEHTRSDRIEAWRRSPSTLPDDVPAVFSFLAVA